MMIRKVIIAFSHGMSRCSDYLQHGTAIGNIMAPVHAAFASLSGVHIGDSTYLTGTSDRYRSIWT